MESREGKKVAILSFGEFIKRDEKLGQPRYNNFMMRLLMENDEWKAGEEGEAGEFFKKLKKEHPELIDPLLEKMGRYHKIPREKLGEQEANDLLSEIEPDLYRVYEEMKGYGADEYDDLSFSPSE